jgi:signal transduction histidine kinase
MSLRDDTPPDGAHDPLDLLRHDLKTPLTTIHGRAQLLARRIQRSPSLAAAERTRMLEGLVAIDTAVAAMVAIIDAMGGDHRDGDKRTESPS